MDGIESKNYFVLPDTCKLRHDPGSLYYRKKTILPLVWHIPIPTNFITHSGLWHECLESETHEHENFINLMLWLVELHHRSNENDIIVEKINNKLGYTVMYRIWALFSPPDSEPGNEDEDINDLIAKIDNVARTMLSPPDTTDDTQKKRKKTEEDESRFSYKKLNTIHRWANAFKSTKINIGHCNPFSLSTHSEENRPERKLLSYSLHDSIGITHPLYAFYAGLLFSDSVSQMNIYFDNFLVDKDVYLEATNYFEPDSSSTNKLVFRLHHDVLNRFKSFSLDNLIFSNSRYESADKLMDVLFFTLTESMRNENIIRLSAYRSGFSHSDIVNIEQITVNAPDSSLNTHAEMLLQLSRIEDSENQLKYAQVSGMTDKVTKVIYPLLSPIQIHNTKQIHQCIKMSNHARDLVILLESMKSKYYILLWGQFKPSPEKSVFPRVYAIAEAHRQFYQNYMFYNNHASTDDEEAVQNALRMQRSYYVDKSYSADSSGISLADLTICQLIDVLTSVYNLTPTQVDIALLVYISGLGCGIHSFSLQRVVILIGKVQTGKTHAINTGLGFIPDNIVGIQTARSSKSYTSDHFPAIVYQDEYTMVKSSKTPGAEDEIKREQTRINFGVMDYSRLEQQEVNSKKRKKTVYKNNHITIDARSRSFYSSNFGDIPTALASRFLMKPVLEEPPDKNGNRLTSQSATLPSWNKRERLIYETIFKNWACHTIYLTGLQCFKIVPEWNDELVTVFFALLNKYLVQTKTLKSPSPRTIGHIRSVATDYAIMRLSAYVDRISSHDEMWKSENELLFYRQMSVITLGDLWRSFITINLLSEMRDVDIMVISELKAHIIFTPLPGRTYNANGEPHIKYEELLPKPVKFDNDNYYILDCVFPATRENNIYRDIHQELDCGEGLARRVMDTLSTTKFNGKSVIVIIKGNADPQYKGHFAILCDFINQFTYRTKNETILIDLFTKLYNGYMRYEKDNFELYKQTGEYISLDDPDNAEYNLYQKAVFRHLDKPNKVIVFDRIVTHSLFGERGGIEPELCTEQYNSLHLYERLKGLYLLGQTRTIDRNIIFNINLEQANMQYLAFIDPTQHEFVTLENYGTTEFPFNRGVVGGISIDETVFKKSMENVLCKNTTAFLNTLMGVSGIEARPGDKVYCGIEKSCAKDKYTQILHTVQEFTGTVKVDNPNKIRKMRAIEEASLDSEDFILFNTSDDYITFDASSNVTLKVLQHHAKKTTGLDIIPEYLDMFNVKYNI